VRQSEIIGADSSAKCVAIAHVAHIDGSAACSGSLIAPTLVVTAKHCVFRAAVNGDSPLAKEGFRIGFGPSRDTLEESQVTRVAWIGMQDELSIESAVLAGEDVAVLELSEPAPLAQQPFQLDLTWSPIDQQVVTLGGYGVTDVETGASGWCRLGAGLITAYEPETGIVQIEGASACFGDSGGPILAENLTTLLGVISEVGGSSDAASCDVGLTFAATAANTRVRRLLAQECARVGGCGGPSATAPSDAGQERAPPGPVEAGEDFGTVLNADAAADAEQPRIALTTPASVGENEGCRCSVPGRFCNAGSELWLLGTLALLLRPRRIRRSDIQISQRQGAGNVSAAIGVAET